MKRLAKDTAVYGLSSILGRMLNWLLVPMYSRVLAGTGEFGVMTNLYGWTALYWCCSPMEWKPAFSGLSIKKR